MRINIDKASPKNIGRSRVFWIVGLAVIIVLLTFAVIRYATDTPRKIKPGLVSIVARDGSGRTIHQGTGFSVAANRIVVSRHVLLGAKRIEVISAADKLLPAECVVADNAPGDIAILVLKAPKGALQTLRVSRFKPLRGEPVSVISLSANQKLSITQAKITSINNIHGFGEVARISKPIPERLTGSPVINEKGEVTGIISSQIIDGHRVQFVVPGSSLVKIKPGRLQTIADYGSIAQWPDAAGGLYAKGLTLFVSEDYKHALPYLKQATEKSPRFYDAWFRLGSCLLIMRRCSEAENAYMQATKICAEEGTGYYGLGLVYARQKKYNKALDAITKAINLGFKNTAAYLLSAGIRYHLKQYDEAIKDSREMIKIDPYDVDGYYYLGFIYYHLHKLNSAKQAYEKAVQINPNVPDGYMGLEYVYADKEEYSKAADECNRAIDKDPNCKDAYIELAYNYIDLRHIEKAIEPLKQAVRIDPKDGQTYLELAYTYRQLNMNQEALDASKKAVELMPKSAKAYEYLGYAYTVLNRNENAVTAYKQAIRFDPKSAALYDRLGIVYARYEDQEAAILAYMKSISLDPKNARAHYNLGLAYNKQGDYDKAIIVLKQACVLDASDPDAHYMLGIIYLRQNKKILAWQEHKALTKLDPRQARILYTRIMLSRN
ncbi:MAG: tetratricopeptide repeat protein [Armatimonadota bacterium]